jgi:hypothetical protein
MKYFLYNPYTKNSEGPYTIDMLRELVSKEQIQPDSKLCPPGGNKWIDAAEIGELFSTAPIPDISEKNDDFVHPLSKKGIKLQQKSILKGQGWNWIISGSSILLMGIFLYFFFLRHILSFLGSYTYLYAFIPFTTIALILIILGIYQLKKGKKINPDK